MNTYLNLHAEFNLAFIFRLRYLGLGVQRLDERAKVLNALKKIPLKRRIFRRGQMEQWQNRYASNYYGSKRLTKVAAKALLYPG